MDRKSLTVMSKAGGLVGDKRGTPCLQKPCLPLQGENVVDFVFKTLTESPRLWGTPLSNGVVGSCTREGKYLTNLLYTENSPKQLYVGKCKRRVGQGM